MRGELEKKLAHEFEFMRRIKDVSDGTNYEWQGCRCGDGWYELIRRFCIEVTKLFEKRGLPVDVTIHKIEEHHGTLRIHCYTEQFPLRKGLIGIVEHFEYLSENTCEKCGAKDIHYGDKPIRVSLRKDLSYTKVLCDNCYSEEIKRNEEQKAKREAAKSEAVPKPSPSASDDEDDDITRKFVMLPEDVFTTEDIDGGCVITGFTGTVKGDWFYASIPPSIGLKPVIAIGEEAFAYCDFSYVALPGCLTSIGDGAFALNFHLHTVIPEGVTFIGDNAFWGCTYLENVSGKHKKHGADRFTIPESVSIIGKNAFSGCKNTVLRCYKDSSAHKYALGNHLKYELIGYKKDEEYKMRTNQVSIRILRFGNQIAEGYEREYENRRERMKDIMGENSNVDELPSEHQTLSIYADANNLYEALSAAFNESVQVVQHFDAMPKSTGDMQFPSGGSNEVNIFVEHFGEDNSFDEYFKVKAQTVSENIFEALSLAVNEVLQEAQKHTTLPTFGRKENYSIDGWKKKYGYSSPNDEE